LEIRRGFLHANRREQRHLPAAILRAGLDNIMNARASAIFADILADQSTFTPDEEARSGQVSQVQFLMKNIEFIIERAWADQTFGDRVQELIALKYAQAVCRLSKAVREDLDRGKRHQWVAMSSEVIGVQNRAFELGFSFLRYVNVVAMLSDVQYARSVERDVDRGLLQAQVTVSAVTLMDHLQLTWR